MGLLRCCSQPFGCPTTPLFRAEPPEAIQLSMSGATQFTMSQRYDFSQLFSFVGSSDFTKTLDIVRRATPYATGYDLRMNPTAHGSFTSNACNLSTGTIATTGTPICYVLYELTGSMHTVCNVSSACCLSLAPWPKWLASGMKRENWFHDAVYSPPGTVYYDVILSLRTRFVLLGGHTKSHSVVYMSFYRSGDTFYCGNRTVAYSELVDHGVAPVAFPSYTCDLGCVDSSNQDGVPFGAAAGGMISGSTYPGYAATLSVSAA